MQYTNLGRSGLTVSRLCLGTLNVGPIVTEAEAHGLMDSARDLGVNFFDTSNSYGRHTGRGRAEQIIGSWFALGGSRREDTVLATKVYVAIEDRPNAGGLSALNIRRAVDASLRRLQTDYIDLYQLHHIDRKTPWDEIWQAMELAVAQGKVIYAGSSNFAGWHLAQAQEAAARRHFTGLVSEQSIYNLLTRDVEREVIPAAMAYGLGLLAWSPLHEGLLGGILRGEREGIRRVAGRAAVALPRHRDQLDQFERFAGEAALEPAKLALAWLLHQPAVTAPIIGPRTHEHLVSAVEATEIRLEEASLARLNEIFPGYKTAPEDYAW